jgi:hypothetical protein
MRARELLVYFLTASGCAVHPPDAGEPEPPLDMAYDAARMRFDAGHRDLGPRDLSPPAIADLDVVWDFSGANRDAHKCGPGVDTPALEGDTHVPAGTAVSYANNPPHSGSHWPNPMPWGSYDPALAREYWVHNLEHGGIVLAYNCPGGCAAEVDQLKAIRNGLKPDYYNAVRVIVTPDATMPRKFAALSWGWRWQSDTLDADLVRCFIAARYDQAPESLP